MFKKHLAVIVEMMNLLKEIVREFFDWPWRGREILAAIAQMSFGSFPIIAISTAFAGIVITNEITWHMKLALQNVSMTPGLTGQFLMRELGIAIPALLVVSKVGAAMAAEVGSMKITEQIDALKLLRINPVAYLVFPRWIACIVSLVCLTLLAVVITLACAMGVAVLHHGFNYLEYLNQFKHFVKPIDLICTIVKSAVFGAVIPVVCCAYGFHCDEGAEGVGSATTNAVVTSTIAIILLDFILTFAFSFFI